MTDNFELMRTYMIENGIPMLEKNIGDLFFEVELVRRGKDHPNLSAANYTFKSYYIDNIEKFDKYKNEMIACCNAFGLRAYISVNVKSKEKYTKMCSFKYAQNILNNEYKKPWRVGNHVFGKITAKNDDTWLIDVDDIDINNDDDVNLLNRIKDIANKCESEYNPIVIGQVPTRSGMHVLTRPFKLPEFEKYWKESGFATECPKVQKNHLTLLYENIDDFHRHHYGV